MWIVCKNDNFMPKVYEMASKVVSVASYIAAALNLSVNLYSVQRVYKCTEFKRGQGELYKGIIILGWFGVSW